MARTEALAIQKAFRAVEKELQQWADIRDGLVSVSMETEAIETTAPWRLLFRGGGRGFAFYAED